MFSQIGRAATNALNALYAFVVEGGWRESIEDLIDLSQETLTEDVTPFIQDRVDSLYELQTRVGRAIDAIRDDFPNLLPSPEPSSDCENYGIYVENFSPVDKSKWTQRSWVFTLWQDAEEYVTEDTSIWIYSVVDVKKLQNGDIEYRVWVCIESEMQPYTGNIIANICDWIAENDDNNDNDDE